MRQFLAGLRKARSKRALETEILNHKKLVVTLLLFNGGLAFGQGIRMKAGSSGRTRADRVRGPHVILQFSAYPDATLRDEVARRGVRILQYVPDNALMVTAGPDVDLTGLGVAWAGSLSVSDKISPALAGQVSGAVLAVFHPDVSATRMRQIARAQGYDVLTNAGLLEAQLVLSGPLSRLQELAGFDEVAYLLPASPDLAAGNPVAGCAGAVTEAGPVGEYVLAGRGWPKDAAGKVALGYFIRNVTEKMDPAIARAEIERALREWTRYANLSLSPVEQGGARSIDILFGRGTHGDPYPFDGAGGTLAHTFYPAPPNAEPVAGDMHLDADESWHAGVSVDLFSVALHEAGHALGLGHSDRPGSVMYPYYRQVAALADDDITGIQALYGAVTATGPSVPPAVPLPPPTPVQPPVSKPGTADTTPPAIQIVSPGFSIASTSAAFIILSGSAADAVGVSSVRWTASTGGSGTASGTTSWSASVPLLTGTNVITVRAYDAAGNSGWRAITVVRR